MVPQGGWNEGEPCTPHTTSAPEIADTICLDHIVTDTEFSIFRECF